MTTREPFHHQLRKDNLMTKTYLIHAWCLRPFIAYIDPVEAATPEEAIAIARRQPEKLLDAAEECNGDYPWDEFAAYDESGQEVLRVLDPEARLREAAPALAEALEDLFNWLTPDWQQSSLGDKARAALAKAKGE